MYFSVGRVSSFFRINQTHISANKERPYMYIHYHYLYPRLRKTLYSPFEQLVVKWSLLDSISVRQPNIGDTSYKHIKPIMIRQQYLIMQLWPCNFHSNVCWSLYMNGVATDTPLLLCLSVGWCVHSRTIACSAAVQFINLWRYHIWGMCTNWYWRIH